MKKFVKIAVCTVLAGIVLWSVTPAPQQNADYMGPGPMSVVAYPIN